MADREQKILTAVAFFDLLRELRFGDRDLTTVYGDHPDLGDDFLIGFVLRSGADEFRVAVFRKVDAITPSYLYQLAYSIVGALDCAAAGAVAWRKVGDARWQPIERPT